MSEAHNENQGPEVWSLLTASLDNYRGEHEDQFLPPATEDEQRLHRALDVIEKHVFDLLTTGRIPGTLDAELAEFQPGADVDAKILELLAYNVTHHRAEFEVASDVCWRLTDLNKRVGLVAVAFYLLVRAEPSQTAVKYLRRATTLFLAGYTTEVFIMCGAVLEAAMASRFSDEILAQDGMKPAHRRTDVFSLGQRMQYEEDHPFLTHAQRQEFLEVVNWRNDAVHVQPDIAPSASAAIIKTASLLAVILPRAIP